MKYLKAAVFVFLTLSFSIGLQAQNVSDLPSNSFPINLSGGTIMRYDNRYEGIKGTYTLFEQFSLGTIELMKGKFSDVLLNYDAYTDNLLARNEKLKDTVQMRKDMVKNFALKDASGEEFAFTKQSVNGTPTFLLSLVRDTVSLFCRITKTIKKAEIGGAYNTSEKRYDEFITSNTYYIVKETGGLQEIQKSKKGILQAFPEFEDQLSAYLKKSKIDFNNRTQVKLMIMYVNTLK